MITTYRIQKGHHKTIITFNDIAECVYFLEKELNYRIEKVYVDALQYIKVLLKMFKKKKGTFAKLKANNGLLSLHINGKYATK